MTFAEVLPALSAGKRVRRATWHSMARLGGGAEMELLVLDLLASDWTLVEEPAKPHADCGESWCKENGGTPCPARRKALEDARATIARLERELADMRARLNAACERHVAAIGKQNEAIERAVRAERELAEANADNERLRGCATCPYRRRP